MRDATIAVVREKMRLSVGESAVYRLANNRLIQLLESEGMAYKPFGPTRAREPEYLQINTLRSGTIADIRIDRLQDLARTLNTNRLITPAPTGGLVLLNLGHAVDRPPAESPMWMRLPGDRVRAGRTPVLSIRRDEFDSPNERALKDAVNSILVLSDRQPTLEGELGYLKDVVIDSIKAGRSRQVDDHLELYDELVREFLDSLRNWGAAYDAASARREDTTPFHGQWSELRWVERDLREILDVALKQTDFGFAHKLIDTAYGLALHAVNEEEFYVYKHSLDFVAYVYRAAVRTDSDSTARRACERLSFILRELGQLKLASEIERVSNAGRLRFLQDCGLAVLGTLNRLMKVAIDQNRDGDFATFQAAATAAFQRLESRDGNDGD